MYLRIAADGEVLLSRRYTLTLSCPMKFQKFPFDSQVSDRGNKMAMVDSLVHYGPVGSHCIFVLRINPSIQFPWPTLQNCSIHLESYGFNSREVVFNWGSRGVVITTDNPNRYSFANASTEKQDKFYSTGMGGVVWFGGMGPNFFIQ